MVIEDEAQVKQDREKRAATALYWESREFASSRARLIGLYDDLATTEVLTITPTQKVDCHLARYGTNRESTENSIARIREKYAEQQSAAEAEPQAKRQCRRLRFDSRTDRTDRRAFQVPMPDLRVGGGGVRTLLRLPTQSQCTR